MKYEIEVPFGPAAGAINGLNEELLIRQAKEVIASPAGALWVGPFTINRCEGNAEYGRTYYHNAATGETVNSMGLPNVGIDVAEAIVVDLNAAAHHLGKPLIASISAARGEDPSKVLPMMAYRLLGTGVAVEVDYGCPNIIIDHGREAILGYDLEKIEKTRASILVEVGPDATLLEKWPPYIGERAPLLSQMAGLLLKQGGAKYISYMNTIPNVSILDDDGDPALDVPGNVGGLSGRATREVARQQLVGLRTLLPKRIGIISCGGVDSGEEVFRRVENLGAAFTAGVSVYFNGGEKNMDYYQTGRYIADEFMVAKVAHYEKYGLKP